MEAKTLFSASPVLVERCERLDGLQGRWIIELTSEAGAALVPYGRSGDIRQLGETIQCSDGGAYCRPTTYLEALEVCTNHHWRGLRLLFQPDRLDGRTSWPGGYDAQACLASNQRVWEEQYGSHAAHTDCDGMPALDPRFIGDDTGEEMVESLESLEDYPVLDEDDMSALELERQAEAWESWAAADWRKEVEKQLQALAPEQADQYWAEECLDQVEGLASKLEELFYACADQANEYWQEESDGSWWIRCESIAESIDLEDLKTLTGLALLPPSQEWRRQPYPWPGAEPSPLVESLAI